MLLLLTNSRDVTMDLVVHELRSLEEPFMRLNSDRLDEARPVIGLASGWPTLTILYRGVNVEASEITAAYLRRPSLDGLAGRREGKADYVLNEWRALLAALYSELDGRWLNEPSAIEAAENKVRQLRLAATLGLPTPRTIVTNDPVAIRDFIAGARCIVKPLRYGIIGLDGQPHVVFTTRIEAILESDFAAIGTAPVIVQEEVGKTADIRVTVIDGTVFATSIDSQADEAAEVDWRRGGIESMGHAVHELPSRIADRCVSLVAGLGLRFGAIDLVQDRDGAYWFLEINPNGQWGWIQARTGQPIAAAIAAALVGGPPA